MLDVDLVRLIARPGAIESGQNSVAFHLLEIFLVGVIAFFALCAEEEPVFSFCSIAWRSCKNARNGATPVPGPTMTIGVIWIFRQMKMFGRARINRDRNSIGPVGQESRADAFAITAMTFDTESRRQ